MKSTKKVALLLIALLVAVTAVFAGCGGGGTPSPTTYKLIFEQENGTQTVLKYAEGTVPSASEIPAITEKTGYTSAWDKTDFSNAKNGDEITVKPVYTGKQYVVSIKKGEGATGTQNVNVTYGQAYDFSAIIPDAVDGLVFGDAWLNGTQKIEKTGTWSIDTATGLVTLNPYWQVKVTFEMYGAEPVEKLFDLGATLTIEDFPAIVNSNGYTFVWEANAIEKVTNLQTSVTVSTTIDGSWSPLA